MNTPTTELCRINAGGITEYNWPLIAETAAKWVPSDTDMSRCLAKLLLPLQPETLIAKLAQGVEPVDYDYVNGVKSPIYDATAIAAMRVKTLEEAAVLLDASADRQEAVWKEHIASNKNAYATSLHAIPRGYAQDIRALIGKEAP